MTNEEFLRRVQTYFKESIRVLEEKSKEYTVDGDRLASFEEAAYLSNINAVEALIGMATKHYVSIADMAKNPTKHSLAKWREKITDLRNYTFLLEALVEETIGSITDGLG